MYDFTGKSTTNGHGSFLIQDELLYHEFGIELIIARPISM